MEKYIITLNGTEITEEALKSIYDTYIAPTEGRDYNAWKNDRIEKGFIRRIEERSMKYEIHFDALNINGAVVGTGAFCITSSCNLDIDGKIPTFKRMCVEYARLTGIKCSDVRITDIDVRLVGTDRRIEEK